MRQTKTILGLAAIVLLFAQCKDDKGTTTGSDIQLTPGEYLPIAYVDADSILLHFEFYNQLISAYEDKLTKNNASFSAGYQKLQNEAINFQQKLQNNGFASQDRVTQEQNRIQRMEEDLKKRAAQMEQELALEQQSIQQRLSDTLRVGIKAYNTPQKYQMILTKTGNSTILYADDHYNITKEVVDFLNKKFKPVEK
jgi:outer membrane protein